MRSVVVLLAGFSVVAVLACGSPPQPPPAGDTVGTTAVPEAFEPTTPRVLPGTAEGTVRVQPERMSVAQVGTFDVHIAVGAGGIATGGGLLIDIPKAWFAELYPVAKRFQQQRPDAAHYISVTTSRPDVGLEVELEHDNLDGKHTRYPHIAAVHVAKGRLEAGAEVAMTLHKTTAPYLAGEDEVRVAVDRRGDGKFRLLAQPARYQVEAAPATRFALFAPSQAVVGKAVELQLTAFDRFANLASAHGSVTVEGLGAEALRPTDGSLERGATQFRWRPQEPGFHWPVAVLRLATPDGETERRVAGDPIRVFAEEPSERIFWGDLHTHSAISKDAIGRDDFSYARDVTRLDFLASTEHSEDDLPWRIEHDGITPAEWDTIQRRVRRFYEPGCFVTLLGYEYTLHTGHHCVYFRTDEGAPWNPRRVGAMEKLWRKLDPDTAFTVPHHLGRSTGSQGRPDIAWEPQLGPPPPPKPGALGGPWVDWRRPGPTPPELRPALEIYSLHGTSEHGDPNDPLAYNSVLYLASRPHAGQHYARHAWALRHRLGTVAGSDNHTAQPGQPQAGLTAVLAPALNREAIFDAIAARRTYATTGRRIYLEFEAAGIGMGGEGTGRRDLAGSVLVAAPGPIEFVQVMRYRGAEEGWLVAKEWRHIGRRLEDRFFDRIESREVIYYLRVGLAEPEGDRAVRAWSSPIWLEIRP